MQRSRPYATKSRSISFTGLNKYSPHFTRRVGRGVQHSSKSRIGSRHMLRAHFHAFLDGIRGEDRYRIFTDLERHADHPPYATWHRGGSCREVVVWCSNDYLAMGRHPAVINAMIETAVRTDAGAGGRGISPATATRSPCSRQNLPTCIARKPHSALAPAMSPMRLR